MDAKTWLMALVFYGVPVALVLWLGTSCISALSGD